ncbi:MAG: hypothetical protein A2Y02_00190 [Omnitrophica bacterium GWA2_52_12]|nr:MAG: hypothetical protein A2Y02_00190 [Omnitrophica bacterium GWA2_52_12]
MAIDPGYAAESDEALVASAKLGHDGAFNELVRRHKEKMLRLAWVWTGNAEDGKDVSQEAFVKAYQGLKKFDGRAKFSTWLSAITANAARDHLRKRRLKRFLLWREVRDMDFFLESVPDNSPGPERGASRGELAGQIQKIIAVLPEKQRVFFVLRFMDGHSLHEIAEMTGVAEGTVKAGLHFAVKKFKAAFEKSS